MQVGQFRLERQVVRRRCREMLRVPPAPVPQACTASTIAFTTAGWWRHAEIVVGAPDRHLARLVRWFTARVWAPHWRWRLAIDAVVAFGLQGGRAVPAKMRQNPWRLSFSPRAAGFGFGRGRVDHPAPEFLVGQRKHHEPVLQQGEKGQDRQQGIARLRPRRGGGRQAFQPAACRKAQRGDRNGEEAVHRAAAEMAGQMGQGRGQEFGVDVGHTEEQVQLGRDARDEQHREGQRAEVVRLVPGRSRSIRSVATASSDLVPGDGAEGADEPFPFRRVGGQGEVFGPVMTPDRKASSIQPQIASADRNADIDARGRDIVQRLVKPQHPEASSEQRPAEPTRVRRRGPPLSARRTRHRMIPVENHHRNRADEGGEPGVSCHRRTLHGAEFPRHRRPYVPPGSIGWLQPDILGDRRCG